MDSFVKEVPLMNEEEYATQSRLLKEFTDISNIDKAWVYKSDSGKCSKAMIAISPSNLLANKKRSFFLSAHVCNEIDDSINFQWAPFPIELIGASAFVPSPSGTKFLIVRNAGNESSFTQFEIWSSSQLEREFQVPQSVHGSVYTDGWFEGISWNTEENRVAYVAEEPCPSKPIFNNLGFKRRYSTGKDTGYWEGQGEWEEDWGVTYVGMRQPAIFVIDINSGEVRTTKGIARRLNVSQVVWAPSIRGSDQYLIFVGWSTCGRKLGIKYCFNRLCALYAVKDPFSKLAVKGHESKSSETENVPVVNLIQVINSAPSKFQSRWKVPSIFICKEFCGIMGACCN